MSPDHDPKLPAPIIRMLAELDRHGGPGPNRSGSFGRALLDAPEQQVAEMDVAGAIGVRGRMALSGAWVRAGLRPPAVLAASTLPSSNSASTSTRRNTRSLITTQSMPLFQADPSDGR